MIDILVTSVNAVFPIVLLIVLGYCLKRIGLINDAFLKCGNKLVFNVCLPCMLFVNIYDKMDSFADIPWSVVLYSLAAIAVIFCLGLLIVPFATKDPKRKGVLLQCVFRSNFAIIGFALVERLGGDMAVAGIVSAFSIPVFNVLAVISLSVFVKDEEKLPLGQQVKKIAKGIVTNPLIIAIVLGLVFVGLREAERAIGGRVVFSLKGDLTFLYTALSDLKLIASPFALIVLGGQFKFSAVKGMTKEIVIGTIGRIVAAPLIGIGAAYLMSTYTDLCSFDATIYPTFVALFGSPVAVSSAIMAGAMHNDEQLATQYVVWTSLGSIVTIFVTVFLLMSIGLIVV